jgi:hypothetical protein
MHTFAYRFRAKFRELLWNHGAGKLGNKGVGQQHKVGINNAVLLSVPSLVGLTL